jgi:hypothetical protein
MESQKSDKRSHTANARPWQWRSVAASPAVGMAGAELDDFRPAFEHAQLRMAHHILRG